MEASRFKQLFLPQSGRLYAVALRLTGNSQSAEDLVQDTLLRLWMKRDSLPPGFDAAGYAVITLRNIFLDGKRRREIQETDEPLEQLALASDGRLEADESQADDVELVRRLISQLPPKQRMVITMRDLEGLDSQEMRRATGLSDINIRTLLSRARSTVRQQFKKLSANGRSEY